MDLLKVSSRVAAPDSPSEGGSARPTREFQFQVTIGITIEVPWDGGLDPEEDEPSESMRDAARKEFWKRLNSTDPDQVGDLVENT